ncbi:MAG: formate C-acetyltransferase/glycerol dehydratase family glycyl radical enzyme, partial [Thermoplasmata archaeon]|nr:formate C-acetyltransferase/glycerol dehydratase family glycyl radical enzyme [Thermoplasmata archaeon]
MDRLRNRLFAGEYEVCTQRARYLTDSFKDTEGGSMIIRQAKALRHILANMDVNIYSDELIVGNMTSKPLGAGVFPELIGNRILAELDTLDSRDINPFKIMDEEKGELRDIMAYWQGKTVLDRASKEMDLKTRSLMESIGAFILTEVAGISHVIMDHPKILAIGYDGIREEAEAKLADLGPEDKEKCDFYNALLIVCDAYGIFADRYGRLAAQLAEREDEPPRKKELLEIARVCNNASKPPNTFHEALQTLWFSQVIAHIESYEQGISLGRFDQYMLPFYERDVKEKRLKREETLELLECLFIKMSQSIPLFDSEATLAFEGMPINQAVTIGGSVGGQDATNQITYLVLDAMDRVKTRQPNVHLRVHGGTPEELMTRAAKSLAKGAAHPSFFNDKTVIPGLVSVGVSASDAENYATVGCVEITIPYKTYGSTDAALMNLGACLDTALNGGKGRLLSDMQGAPTPDPRKFRSMEDVLGALREQIAYFVGHMCGGASTIERVHQVLKPTPFLSATVEGCMESGKDIIH